MKGVGLSFSEFCELKRVLDGWKRLEDEFGRFRIKKAAGSMTKKAEPLYGGSLAIFEKALGPEHRNVANPLSNLAGLYEAQGRYAEAEPLFQRSLAINEKVPGASDGWPCEGESPGEGHWSSQG